MLKPKKKIAIVYGHKPEILNFIKDKIRDYDRQGYRVKPVILSAKELRTKKGFIYQTLTELFRGIDAAIVFMTSDDKGKSNKEIKSLIQSDISVSPKEFLSQLNERARQNVIFELGYIAALIGEGNYRVFADESIEIPSDIQGKYLERNFEFTNIAEVTKELIEVNLGVKKRLSSIEDVSYHLDYSDLQQKSYDNLLDFFEYEYSELDEEGDKIIYLFERIVFDSYYQRPEWWQEKYKTISSSCPKINFAKNLLEEITRYMRLWLPPEKKEYSMIYLCADKLQLLLNNIQKFEPLNPIIKIVSYNYLGLAYNKIGSSQKIDDENKRLNYLECSKKAFNNTIELAIIFDDPLLPLWQGYSTFNLARTINEIDRIKHKKDLEELWRETFALAIEVRDGWTKTPYNLPVEIEEGLSTEYLYAKAERIRRAKIDDKNKLIECFPYEIDERFIYEAQQEYLRWEKDPKQLRVRLAKNLHESWGVINERFKQIQ